MRAHARAVDRGRGGGPAADAARRRRRAARARPSDDAAATATSRERLLEHGRDVAIELNRLCEGDLRGMFDGPTTADLDLDAPLIVFDLSALDADGEALPILMACVGVWLQFVWVRPDGRKRIFVVEEGWHVIGNLHTARLFRRLWKLARGLGLQNIAVVHHLRTSPPAGGPAADAVNALLEEAQTRVVYRQSAKETRARHARPRAVGVGRQADPGAAPRLRAVGRRHPGPARAARHDRLRAGAGAHRRRDASDDWLAGRRVTG